MCGTPLVQVCANCGHANALGFLFCIHCGIALSDAPNHQPAPQPQLPLWEAHPPQNGPERPWAGTEMQPLEGERRIASVILADVASSTDLMERIGTERWVALMNRVFQILEAEIYRFGGEVEQFRGDGLVAFFGAHVANEDDPEHAVLAGLAMQRAIQQYAEALESEQGITLKLRVGVNTGEVVVATVGDIRQHREYTAMGEAVAMASRMETSAELGTVLVSENTYRLVQLRFKWQSLGQIMVKGVSRPVSVYRPLDLQPYTDQSLEMQAAASYEPLTGRELEFEVLKKSIENLNSGHGSIVLVIGEKGMGKSLLVSRVRQHFGRQKKAAPTASEMQPEVERLPEPRKIVQWFTGRSRSYDQTWPYAVWRELVKRWFGVLPDEDAQAGAERLYRRSLELWGDETDRFYPTLATFLSLPLDERYADRVMHLTAEALQREFFSTICNWAEAVGRQNPTVFSFVDLQWTDSRSLELLKHCLPVCDTQPVLWLVQMRPDRDAAAWSLRQFVEKEFPHRLTEIALRALSEEESAVLVEQMIGPGVLTKETRDLIIHKAEGYPYFLQELIHMLMLQGVLAQDDETGAWRQTRSVSSLDMPDSLQGLVLARIDRLTPVERRVLQLAAVIGMTFWQNVLDDLVGSAEQVREALTGLQRAQLIQERAPVTGVGMEFFFHSSLVREVAYESLLSAQQTACHLHVAQYLEDNLEVEVGEQFDSTIAYHYRCGGHTRKELFYTLTAAERARRVYANVEALELYNRAVELLDKLDAEAGNKNFRRMLLANRFEVLSGRGEIYRQNGEVDASRADSKSLLQIADQLSEDPAWMIDALIHQPEVTDPTSRDEIIATGLPMARRAQELALQIKDKRREMNSLLAITKLLLILKDPGWQDVAERALDQARQLHDLRMEVDLLFGIGEAYGLLNPERAKEYLDAAMSISQTLDDKEIEMTLLSAMGPQYERSGDYYKQLTEFELKRVEIGRELNNRMWEGHALMFCGQIQGSYLGDFEGGLAYVNEALSRWENTEGRIYPMMRKAQILISQENYEEAQALLEEARPICDRGVVDLARAGIELVTSMLYLALGGPEHLRADLELLQRVQALVDEEVVPRQYEIAANCHRTSAHLGLMSCAEDEEHCQEHKRLALAASTAAVAGYESFGFLQVVECVSEEVLFRHSQALSANGREDEAKEYIRRAYDEMMRKHAFIPSDSPFRRTFLENISLHREIQAAYTAR